MKVLPLEKSTLIAALRSIAKAECPPNLFTEARFRPFSFFGSQGPIPLTGRPHAVGDSALYWPFNF